MWGHLNKELPKPVTLYANKIKVSPKEDTISYGELIEKITEKTKPIKANDIKYKVKDKSRLEISLMDMHFGVNTFNRSEERRVGKDSRVKGDGGSEGKK